MQEQQRPTPRGFSDKYITSALQRRPLSVGCKESHNRHFTSCAHLHICRVFPYESCDLGIAPLTLVKLLPPPKPKSEHKNIMPQEVYLCPHRGNEAPKQKAASAQHPKAHPEATAPQAPEALPPPKQAAMQAPIYATLA